MNVLPPAILSARAVGTKLLSTLPIAVRTVAAAPPRKMEILPPAILSARPIGIVPDKIELIPESPAPGKKKGRPSKKEKMKEARASATASISALLESNPNKAAIREYFENRISELND